MAYLFCFVYFGACAWYFLNLYFTHRANMVRIHYEWLAMAEDAERSAIEVEDAAPTLIIGHSDPFVDWHKECADWFWHTAARYRVNAAKYIKYLPLHDRERALNMNTSVGMKSNETAQEHVQPHL